MKQTGYVHIEVEKDGKSFFFGMPMGAPLADAADAAFKIFKSCDKMYREAIDKEISEKEEKDGSLEEAIEIKTDSDNEEN